MCFKKPKPDPQIVKEQETQKAEVAAKKQEEMDVAATARKQQVEETKQTKKTEAQIAATQEDQQARQQELSKSASLVSTPDTQAQGSELTSTGLAAKSESPSAAMLRRRSSRSGKGRRSLLTSSAGGVGYFSRFL